MLNIIGSFINYEVLIKLGICACLGLVIGLEREIKRKPLGLKTSLVISIVACLLTIVSIDTAYQPHHTDYDVNITMDPLRLAAQIVSGIGFLGAGVILRRGNDSISGLTTAAIIWGAAGIGIAVGAGFYFEAISGVLLIIVSVEIIPLIMSRIGPKQLREQEIRLEITVEKHSMVSRVIEHLREQKISIQHIRIRDLEENDHLIQLKVGVHFNIKITELYEIISKIKGVKHVEIESLR